jgi:uncharacterized protein YhaN
MEDEARLGRGCESAATLQDLLARIGDQSERYAELRLASAILQRAVETYRKENQGTVLERAGALFRRLTRDSFVALDTYDDNGEPALLGLRSGNQAAVPVAGMSEGTRDQLYLALKLASLEERLRTGPVLPLVLDDILVNFDDDRAAAALEILAELSHRTQILFFTHHEHLVDLAESRLSNDVLFVNRLRN